MKWIKRLFCTHQLEMTDAAKQIPPLNGEGVETREHQCKKCGKKVMLSQHVS